MRGISARFHLYLIETADVGDRFGARVKLRPIFPSREVQHVLYRPTGRSIDRSVDRADVGRKRSARFHEGALRRKVVYKRRSGGSVI